MLRRIRSSWKWQLFGFPIAVATLAVGVYAQTPIDRVSGQIDVVEVLLDVVVTDSEGNVIVGLDEGAFVVEEDGREMKIESVSFYSNRGLWSGFDEAAAAADDPDLVEDRFFVLFFHRPPMVELRDMTYYAKVSRAGRQALDWVARGVMPNDYLAIVTYDGALNVVQNFTRDHELIVQAVWKASTGKAPKKRWKSRTSEAIPGVSLEPLMGPDVRERTGDLFSAVTELAGGLGGVSGRKVLVLLGADFPSESTPDSKRHYTPMVEALNTHNVAVYPVDVTAEGQRPTLIRLAEDTGGRYASRGRSTQESLADISRENSGYYLLSYRASKTEAASGYQEVTVRTRNPELRARTRSGYRYGSEPAL